MVWYLYMIDAVILSRIQFGFTMTAHILYPSVSIGVVSFLVIMEGLFLWTRNILYLSICKFWSKIFALTFGMGVVSGIVMEFQFGTNWGGFSHLVGPTLGALFVYEVLSAFFIEAGFLGIMLFGWNKVGPKLHYFSTCMVAFGTSLSAFMVMAANSWMQVPTSYKITAQGQFVGTDWLGVIFGPTSLTRFIHMLVSCYLTGSFIILGVSAFYLYYRKHKIFARTCFNAALVACCLLSPLQMMIGHAVGEGVYHHQPLKTAAMEGLWETQKGAPAILFTIPHQQDETNYFTIGSIPKLASFVNTGDWDAEMVGLKSVAPELRPNVFMVFWTFRIMVGCGLAMIAVSYLGALLAIWQQHHSNRYYLILCMLASPLGIIAIETGWMTAEIGRQPWTVYGLLKTADLASKLDPIHVLTSLILLIIVYSIIFGYFFFRYLFKVIANGPTSPVREDDLAFHYLSTFEEEKPSNRQD